MSGGLAAGTNDKRCPIPPVPCLTLPSCLHDPDVPALTLWTALRGRKGPGRGGHSPDHIPGSGCHAPHPIGVLGQAVGKLLSSPRLGAIEHDDVPALEMAGHTGSVRGQEPQASPETQGDQGAGGSSWHPFLLQVLSKPPLGQHLTATATAAEGSGGHPAGSSQAIKVSNTHSCSKSHRGQIFK